VISIGIFYFTLFFLPLLEKAIGKKERKREGEMSLFDFSSRAHELTIRNNSFFDQRTTASTEIVRYRRSIRLRVVHRLGEEIRLSGGGN
jgi:hypothetical protein